VGNSGTKLLQQKMPFQVDPGSGWSCEACSSFTRLTACQVARPPFRGLCHEVPARPVSRPSRPLATESNHQLFEWVLPPLVICPFRAHSGGALPACTPAPQAHPA
jgi:hypothetical protein